MSVSPTQKSVEEVNKCGKHKTTIDLFFKDSKCLYLTSAISVAFLSRTACNLFLIASVS